MTAIGNDTNAMADPSQSPCPFCGSAETFVCECEDETAGCSTFWVECADCAGRGSSSEYKEGAVQYWEKAAAIPVRAYTVPPGWKLVPESPTQGMVDAARQSWVNDQGPKASTLWGSEASDIYKAMLRAAPPPDADQPTLPMACQWPSCGLDQSKADFCRPGCVEPTLPMAGTTESIVRQFIERQQEKLTTTEGAVDWRSGYMAALNNLAMVLDALPTRVTSGMHMHSEEK
jgi:hypothetical protein